MRRRGLVALWASAAAHAALVLVAWGKDAPITPVVVKPAPIELVEVPPIEIEVVTLPGATASGADDQGSIGSRSRAIASRPSGPGPGTAPAPETGASTPAPVPAKPARTTIVLPMDAIMKIVDRPGLRPPHVPADSGKLDPAGGGTKIARDAVTNLKVDADGTAHFDDRSDNSIALAVPGRRALGTMLEAWYENPEAQTYAPPVCELPAHEQAVPGGWDSGVRQGSVASEAAENGIVPILRGGFDLTSWAMRAAGDDPYRARKQALLDATFDERAEMRATHTADQQARAEQLVRANLTRLWRIITDPAERRLALFELWDECEEGDGPAGDAGERARRQVIGWIRAKLPAGSADAYAADELRRLNADRKSKRMFDPYSR